MTTWSRDRWLLLRPQAEGTPGLILAPGAEQGARLWPTRRGDARIASDLAQASGGAFRVARSRLFFDGGDFVCDEETVFVAPSVLSRNLGVTVATQEELQQRLEGLTRCHVVLLAEAPSYHAGMFMMPVGNRTLLVGDLREAKKLHAEDSSAIQDLYGRAATTPDWSSEACVALDRVAEQCEQAGYRVQRIPVVQGKDARTWLTPLNVVIDVQGTDRTVYMPVYRGAEALNARAAAVWEGLGYQVRAIDCTETFAHFGSLRCLVNVLQRR